MGMLIYIVGALITMVVLSVSLIKSSDNPSEDIVVAPVFAIVVGVAWGIIVPAVVLYVILYSVAIYTKNSNKRGS